MQLATDVSASILRTFDKYNEQNWESIKEKCLAGDLAKKFKELAQALKAMLQCRDIIGFFLYHAAIDKIFPEHDYNVEMQSKPSHDCCWIKINTPGSRILISDRDTSKKAVVIINRTRRLIRYVNTYYNRH